MRPTFLPFHSPDIGEEEIQSVCESLRSGWLTTGPKSKKFEDDFSRYMGANHSIAVNSCTGALHLALEAIGIKSGDEVIVPTITFASTANVVHHLNATPVLVDCSPDTLTINPNDVEKAITEKTKAIVPVHMAGHPCEMDAILGIAKKSGLRIIEDAAHALPTRYKGKLVGKIGDITCFSFYATKTITTGEGGMITTQDSDLADRMRVMSLHGISRDAWARYTEKGSWYYEILSSGYKYNMTDLAAAIGIHQLKKVDSFAEARKKYAQIYEEGFRDIPEIQTPAELPNCEHAWHLYIIQLDTDKLRTTRDKIIENLKQKNIGTSVHFIPLHMHPYFKERYGFAPEEFPVASAAYKKIISLPIYPKMQEEDVHYVIETLREIILTERK